MEAKYAAVDAEIARLENTHVAPTPELRAALEALGTAAPGSGVSLAARCSGGRSSRLRRPRPLDPDRPPLPRAVTAQVEIRLRYEGYIKKAAQAGGGVLAHGKPRPAGGYRLRKRSPVCAQRRRQKLAALRPEALAGRPGYPASRPRTWPPLAMYVGGGER